MNQQCSSLSVFSFLPVDSLYSSRAASVAILPSALFCERDSLGARWVFSFQYGSEKSAVYNRLLVGKCTLTFLKFIVIRIGRVCILFGLSQVFQFFHRV